MTRSPEPQAGSAAAHGAPAIRHVAPVAVALLDTDGVIRGVSGAAVRVAGQAFQSLLGRKLAELVHPEDRSLWAKASRLAGTGASSGPREVRLRGEHSRWLPVELECIGHPAIPGLVATLRDPTARDPVAEQARRLSLAIEQGPAAVLTTDPDGRIQYVNRRFTEMSGYAPEEVLGQTPRILKSGLTPPEAYEEMWATIRGGHVWRGELCNRRKDGELYWHSASISPVHDAAGRVSGFVAVQEDITEQRRVREELAAHEREYRRIVDTATEGIWGVEAEHRTTFANERLASMLGIPWPKYWAVRCSISPTRRDG